MNMAYKMMYFGNICCILFTKWHVAKCYCLISWVSSDGPSFLQWALEQWSIWEKFCLCVLLITLFTYQGINSILNPSIFHMDNFISSLSYSDEFG